MTLKNLLKALAASSLVALGLASAPAHALLTLNPETQGTAISGTANCGAVCFSAIVGADPVLVELYKSDAPAPGTESGSLASSYDTAFNPATAPETATITYIGGSSMDCLIGTCYLLVKDGQNVPNQIYFNLSALGWNGVESIFISDPLIWPDGGSISHLSLFGYTGEVCTRPGGCFPEIPEPGTVALFGLGMLGLVAARRRSR